MATLRFTTHTMLASALGPPSPLPDLRGGGPAKAQGRFDPAKQTPEQAYSRAAHIRGCLPYALQDGFDRRIAERPFRVAVLESDRLRATFLLELGGRLWSLRHKPTGRELLYQPRVLHFANIGLCRAWFAGGVEWNIAVRGHAACTCSPVFAAEVDAGDGNAALRTYEWDRFRDLLWQIDFLLADDVPALLARPRVINTRDETVPMYWWSNVAVPEAPGHRVLVPADHAYQHDYERNILRRPVPVQDGTDVSYPTNCPSAHDYFYDLPAGGRPWIAALDEAGAGLVHASTRRLLGRKLFVWGTSPGGRRWQQHLGAGDGRGYVEIQAGLARTQADYLPMPARAEWSWLEAYAPLAADAAVVHGGDWAAAHRHVQERLDAMLPQGRLDRTLAETADLADRPPRQVHLRGSPWGAVERQRRDADGEDPAVPPSMDFGADADGPWLPWQALLRNGELPYRPPAEPPGPWVTHPAWRKRLADAAAAGRGDHWLTWLHLGVMAYRAGETDAAAEAWRTSLAREPSAWACRNLAVLAMQQGQPDRAAELYLRAVELKADVPALQVECGRALLEARRFDDLADWLAGVPEEIRRAGRIRLLSAWATCHRGDLDAAEALLDELRLDDIREGETAPSDLWFEIQARRAAAAENVPLDDALRRRIRRSRQPPAHIDYRMSGPTSPPARTRGRSR